MGCEKDTLEHKQMVVHYMNLVVKQLLDRAEHHDDSKLESDELPLFDEVTPKLKAMKYDSPEYKESLAVLKPALEHHYGVNRHHPEHFKRGIRDMNLIDLVEMMCDWKASTSRQRDGNILKSIDINRDRFQYSKDLQEIFENTVQLFEE
jgi:hypothetical protein